jgi:hypothetical protein
VQGSCARSESWSTPTETTEDITNRKEPPPVTNGARTFQFWKYGTKQREEAAFQPYGTATNTTDQIQASPASRFN